MTTGEAKPRAMRLRVRLLLCLLFYAPAIYFKFQGDDITAAFCAVAGMAGFAGYRAGAASILTLLAAVGAGVAWAPSLGQSHEATMAEWFGTTGLTNRFLSIAVAGLLISLVVSSVLVFFGGRFLKKRPRLDAANRWLGLAVGSVEGIAAMILFLGGLLVLEPIEQKRADLRTPNDSRGRILSKFILSTSAKTRESLIGPAVAALNPFTRIPQLNKVEEVQQSVQVLSDPTKIQGLLHHPSIRRLRQRPEVQRAVDRLNRDPEVQQVLRSGRTMDGAMAMTLLNHPAVMELVDQPGFLEEASRVIQSTNLFRSPKKVP